MDLVQIQNTVRVMQFIEGQCRYMIYLLIKSEIEENNRTELPFSVCRILIKHAVNSIKSNLSQTPKLNETHLVYCSVPECTADAANLRLAPVIRVTQHHVPSM